MSSDDAIVQGVSSVKHLGRAQGRLFPRTNGVALMPGCMRVVRPRKRKTNFFLALAMISAKGRGTTVRQSVNRLSSPLVSFPVLALLGGWLPLLAQQPATPTSVPLEGTLETLFEKASGPCDLISKMDYSNFRVLLNYDAGEAAKPRLVVFGNHEIELPAGDQRRVEVAYEHALGQGARVRV